LNLGSGDVQECHALDDTAHRLKRSVQLLCVVLAPSHVACGDRDMGNEGNVVTQMRPQDASIQLVMQLRDVAMPFVGDDEHVRTAVDDITRAKCRSNDEWDRPMPKARPRDLVCVVAR